MSDQLNLKLESLVDLGNCQRAVYLKCGYSVGPLFSNHLKESLKRFGRRTKLDAAIKKVKRWEEFNLFASQCLRC